MPIQFDEISADIAPPPAAADGNDGETRTTPVDDGAQAQQQQWRAMLALLREREARLWVD